MFKDISAVIFDMDGTLIDSMWVWQAIDKEYIESLGYEYTTNFHEAIEGMNFKDTAKYFKKCFNIADDIETIMDTWHKMSYDKYVNDIQFKKGAIALLEILRKKGIKTGIATSNSKELVDAFLYARDAHKYFDYIATCNDVVASKPAPDIYLTVAKNLGVNPEKCLIFEDIPNGLLAGINANMRTCAVADYYSDYCKDEKRDLADYYIESFEDILEEL